MAAYNFLPAFRSAKNKSLNAASALGNEPRLLVNFHKLGCRLLLAVTKLRSHYAVIDAETFFGSPLGVPQSQGLEPPNESGQTRINWNFKRRDARATFGYKKKSSRRSKH